MLLIFLERAIDLVTERLIESMLFTAVYNIIEVISRGKCTYACFPGNLSSSTQQNILYKPLAAFPYSH